MNDELAAVREMMDTAPDKIRIGGRLCVISFHSLEDRIVKTGIARREHGCTCPREAPVCTWRLCADAAQRLSQADPARRGRTGV